MNPILSAHMDLPVAVEPIPQTELQECEFRMMIFPDDPQRPLVAIDGGISRTGDTWKLYAYVGDDSRQWFTVPLNQGERSGEVAQVLASALAHAR